MIKNAQKYFDAQAMLEQMRLVTATAGTRRFAEAGSWTDAARKPEACRVVLSWG